MHRTGGRQLALRNGAGKATAGTTWLRVFVAALITLSTGSAVLYVTILGLDDVYSVRNSQNIYYANNSLTASNDTSSATRDPVEGQTLLFPELHASIGFHTVCVSHNCFARSHVSGISALVANAAQGSTGPPLPERLAIAYEEATSQYIFGFDIGTPCGTSRAKIQSLSNLGVAASALSLVLVLALFAISMILCWLVGDATVNHELHCVTANTVDLPTPYVLHKMSRHLRLKKTLLYSAILSLLVFTMALCTMGVAVGLNGSTSKCGQSVCAAFERAMENFYALADSLSMNVSTPRVYSCRYGSTYLLITVAFSLSAVSLIMNAAMLFVYHRSRYHEKVSAICEQLHQVTGVQSRTDDKNDACSQARRESALEKVSSMKNSMAAVSRDGSDVLRSDAPFAVGGLARRSSFLSTPADVQRAAHSVGGRIELYRRLKQFKAVEEQRRWCIEMERGIEFQACLALGEKLGSNEGLCRLHKFMLDWFVSPILDMCVSETRCRQQLMCEYYTGATALLASLTDGTTVDSLGPAQHRGEGAVLREKVRAVASQRMRQWQEVQGKMCPTFQRTTSCTAAEPRLRRSLSSPSNSERIIHAELNVDGWIRKFEELLTAYVDAAFLVEPLARHTLKANVRDQEANMSSCFSYSSQYKAPLLYSSRDSFVAVGGVRSHVRADSLSATGAAEAFESPFRQQKVLAEGSRASLSDVLQRREVSARAAAA
ncbi:hypothetical protein MNV84_07874 [Leishmania braziliensis]|nr:hypothetical protein MNV84_07874 [Leishmania braziliensis]